MPILDRTLKDILEKIQKEAKAKCQISQGTPTQEIACAISREVQKWEIGNQAEMTQKVEDVAYLLKTKVANLPDNAYVLNKIEAMRNEKDLMRQYETLLFVIGQIPTVKVVSELDLNKKLDQKLQKFDRIFGEIVYIKDKLSCISLDIANIKWNSADVVSNLKSMKEELEKLSKVEGLNTLSIEELNSNQAEILNKLNNNILESLNEIKTLIDDLPKNDEIQRFYAELNELKQSKPEILFQKSMYLIAIIGFAMRLYQQYGPA